MDGLKVIPTYRVINRYNVSRNKVEILLVNLANNFDIITIKVSKNASSMIADRSYYSITTKNKRTWYTLWLGKKEEHHVLGNIDEEGKVLMTVTSASLSDKAIENFKKEWEKSKL